MSIAALSVLRDYDIIWSGDSAIGLPPLPDKPEQLPNEPDDAFAARVEVAKRETKRINEENEAALERARESGNWSALLKPGEEPTVFRVRQVPDWRIIERVASGLGVREVAGLLFRLAVVSISNGPLGYTPKTVEHTDPRTGQRTGIGKVLQPEVTADLDRISKDIVDEVAAIVMQQRGGPLGK